MGTSNWAGGLLFVIFLTALEKTPLEGRGTVAALTRRCAVMEGVTKFGLRSPQQQLRLHSRSSDLLAGDD